MTGKASAYLRSSRVPLARASHIAKSMTRAGYILLPQDTVQVSGGEWLSWNRLKSIERPGLVPFIESGVSSDGRRSGAVLGGTPHNNPFSSSEFPSRASISCELNELDTNQPRENVCLRPSAELFWRGQTGYSRDQGACRLSSLKKKACNPSPSALFSHSFQPDHRVLKGEPGPPRSSLFSLLYSGLRISRASGEVKCWFPALLFRDQKMVPWLNNGLTICDMLTA